MITTYFLLLLMFFAERSCIVTETIIVNDIIIEKEAELPEFFFQDMTDNCMYENDDLQIIIEQE